MAVVPSDRRHDLRRSDVEAVHRLPARRLADDGPAHPGIRAGVRRGGRAPHAVAVNSGTAALHLAPASPRAQPRRRGHRARPHVRRDRARGALRRRQPVLCDVVGPRTPEPRSSRRRSRGSRRARGRLAVHFVGYTAESPRCGSSATPMGYAHRGLRASGRSRGRRERPRGTAGEPGCFSLFSKKQLCVGEGGIVTTSDDDSLRRCARCARTR